MRATIPEEIKQTRLISEEEVVRQAERQSEEIVEEARAREREIRLGAEDYADDILNTLEVNLEKFSAAVRRGRDRLAGRVTPRALPCRHVRIPPYLLPHRRHRPLGVLLREARVRGAAADADRRR